MLDWFQYAIAPYERCPIFQINRHIGFNEEQGYGIDGATISNEILEVDSMGSKHEITFYINCMGGDVKQSFDIFNAIVAAKTKTVAIISGFAYSTGGWIALAADTVKAYEYSQWMCHMPYNPKNEDETSIFLTMVANSVAMIIARKSGKNGKPKKTVDDILAMMQQETFYTAEMLYNEGLIDETLDADGVVINKTETAENQYMYCQTVLNNFIEKKTQKTIVMPDYKNVVNYLSLASGSGEQSIIEELARRQNSFDAVNREKTTLQAQHEAANKLSIEQATKITQLEAQNLSLEEEKKKLEAKNEELDADNKKMTEEKKEAANTAKEQAEQLAKDKAVNLIQKYEDMGKIRTSVHEDENKTQRERWQNMAILNFDNTEAMLIALPTNMRAPKPTSAGFNENQPSLGKGTDADFRAYNKTKREAAQNKK